MNADHEDFEDMLSALDNGPPDYETHDTLASWDELKTQAWALAEKLGRTADYRYVMYVGSANQP